MMPGFFPVPAGGGGPAVSYRDSYTSTSATSSYTFSNCDIGVADTTRIVVVGVSHYRYDTTAALSSVTIGGVAATVVAARAQFIAGGSGSYLYSAIAYRVVPAGTTANVVVSMAAAANMCGIGVWSIYNTANSTPVVSDYSGSTTTSSLDQNVLAGDVGVAVAASGYVSTTSWVGATERYDRSVLSAHGAIEVSGADFMALVSASPRVISATKSGGSAIIGSIAVWR